MHPSVYICKPNAILPAMKIPSILFVLPAAALISCNNTGTDANNPYGAPAAPASPGSNPYAVPQQGGETGNYATNEVPYQPLPNVPNQQAPVAQNPNYLPAPNDAPAANYAPTPDPSELEAPAATAEAGGATTPHVVAAGDTLWGLARKYNTSVEAIQAANGMTDTNARLGQTLQIPGR